MSFYLADVKISNENKRNLIDGLVIYYYCKIARKDKYCAQIVILAPFAKYFLQKMRDTDY